MEFGKNEVTIYSACIEFLSKRTARLIRKVIMEVVLSFTDVKLH